MWRPPASECDVMFRHDEDVIADVLVSIDLDGMHNQADNNQTDMTRSSGER
jgi:hypothetical protein